MIQKAKGILKGIIKGQKGQALLIVLVLLVIGALLIASTLQYASTSLKGHQVTEIKTEALYASDAGIEDAVWKLIYSDDPFPGGATYSLGEELNGMDVTVEVDEESVAQGKLYTVTSSAKLDGEIKGKTLAQIVVAQEGSGGSAVFGYALASLNGDINLGGNSEVDSDGVLEGDIYATGGIHLSGNADVYGDASATATITTSGNAEIHGEEIEGADPLVPPEVDTDSYKAEAQNVTCAICGSYTYVGSNWQPSEGVYEDSVHAKNKMTISGNGTWIFRDTVCVGVDTNEDLVIGGNADVTFEGPVKIGGKLDISGNGTVIFKDTVCVGGKLKSDGNKEVIFDGPVYVEGDLQLAGNDDVPFGGSIYVGGDLKISGNKTVELGGTVYVCGDIVMSGNSDELVGGEAVIAEGNIGLTGNSDFNEAAEYIPFVMSINGDVTLSGNSDVAAVVYAPNGHIVLSGNTDLYGCAVGLSITGSGNNDVFYPIDLRDRGDLPGGGGAGESTVSIVSWQIQ